MPSFYCHSHKQNLKTREMTEKQQQQQPTEWNTGYCVFWIQKIFNETIVKPPHFNISTLLFFFVSATRGKNCLK